MADGTNGKDREKQGPASSLGFTLPFADEVPAGTLANPVAVMAAATAASVAIGTQFATAFLGLMQASMEAIGRTDARDAAAQRAEPKGADARDAEARSAAPEVKTETAPAATVVAATEAPVVTPKVATPKPVRKAAERAEKATAKAATQRSKAASSVAEPVKAPAAKAKASKPAARKAKADDLKKISGIGPKLEDLLNGMGVARYAAIAAWTDKDVEHFDRELGLDGRIAKDDWIAQAKALLR
ncbi:NADH-quinone oxidoreductase subunit E [Rhizobium sp. RU35A]|uniref:5' DNA nuclease n=1 Tax=Rhizobium sp. RU35A TaxID=1907414 RepID=UPI000955E82C|nr:5' DNA nuclease [Rhizobium sp. RU35A]SIP89539.1 NADH-quinone oxidoreductase subunit E [Rhizobium sp. RU35A]